MAVVKKKKKEKVQKRNLCKAIKSAGEETQCGLSGERGEAVVP